MTGLHAGALGGTRLFHPGSALTSGPSSPTPALLQFVSSPTDNHQVGEEAKVCYEESIANARELLATPADGRRALATADAIVVDVKAAGVVPHGGLDAQLEFRAPGDAQAPPPSSSPAQLLALRNQLAARLFNYAQLLGHLAEQSTAARGGSTAAQGGSTTAAQAELVAMTVGVLAEVVSLDTAAGDNPSRVVSCLLASAKLQARSELSLPAALQQAEQAEALLRAYPAQVCGVCHTLYNSTPRLCSILYPSTYHGTTAIWLDPPAVRIPGDTGTGLGRGNGAEGGAAGSYTWRLESRW